MQNLVNQMNRRLRNGFFQLEMTWSLRGGGWMEPCLVPLVIWRTTVQQGHLPSGEGTCTAVGPEQVTLMSRDAERTEPRLHALLPWVTAASRCRPCSTARAPEQTHGTASTSKLSPWNLHGTTTPVPMGRPEQAVGTTIGSAGTRKGL